MWSCLPTLLLDFKQQMLRLSGQVHGSSSVFTRTLPRSVRQHGFFKSRRTSGTRCLSQQPRKFSSISSRWVPHTLFLGLAVAIVRFIRDSYDGSPSLPLNPKVFQHFILKSKDRVSDTSSLFTLTPAQPAKQSYEEIWRKAVWSVQVKQPQLQIARAYTPIPTAILGSDKLPAGSLRLLIRHDRKGELSGYLHKLPLDTKIDVRGPIIEYEIPDDISEILFLAGGTGIAPALQVAHALYERDRKAEKLPKIRILWANRSRDECLGGVSGSKEYTGLWASMWNGFYASEREPSRQTSAKDTVSSPVVEMLKQLGDRYRGRLVVDYFVDEESRYINQGQLSRFLTADESPDNKVGRKLVLVSGPDGFVNYLAGPKSWKNGQEEQGPLRGLLARVDHPGWEVWKL